MAMDIDILIVDDDPNVRKILTDILTRIGYTHAAVEDGKSALAYMSENKPAIALVDLRLDDIDGLELIKKIKELSSSTECIVITGFASQETAIEAINLGAYSYFQKPYDMDQLLVTIHRAAEKHEADRALVISEDRFRSIFEGVQDAIFVESQNGEILDVNSRACQMFGWSREEFLTKTIADLVPEGELSIIAPDMNGKEFPIGPVETVNLRANGEQFPVEITANLQELGKETVLLTVVRDVSKRVQAQNQIKRQLKRLSALRKIDTAITATFDIKIILDVLLGQVITQLKVDAADILLFNKHTNFLEFIAGKGFRTSALRHTSLLIGEGYAGRAALERQMNFIADISLEKNGFGQSSHIKDENFVSYFGIPLIVKGEVKGVLEIFKRVRITPDEEWIEFMEMLASQAAIAIDSAMLFNNLQSSNLELILAYDTTLEGWSRALELRDHETAGHTKRVTEMTLKLAKQMGVSELELPHLRRGVMLHDIGKMGVPDNILLKTEPLTDEEWEVMKQHPVNAHKLLSPISYLRPALDIPYSHHEKWDGSGYPQGLKGEQIPLAARIFAIVDVWDALSYDRPYRDAWPKKKVHLHLKEQAGEHFDPAVVEAFFTLIHENQDHRAGGKIG